ncbi:chemotaxis protein CheC [Halomicroarcula limicola]|uniref:Chemotaxis protein CheC n=1 Tax=Haloarcula limicola TaxID=1429915 RepID=A0A8J7Y9N6_9EURY|nr:chemotaxis protein CheC [Halomicroarcula limicola]MBV0924279.1 chemotaxis protein CheC [Halomicroarcula limicola]
MNVDIQSLGTFNQLAHEGAEQATRSLTQMTGIDAAVDVTKITLLDREDVGEGLAGQEFVGVQFGFEGVLEGETVLVFDSESADTIADALLPGSSDDPAMAESGITEIGNIMMSGFIDGWADYLDSTIDHSPPTYIEKTGANVLPEAPESQEYSQVFVFKSEIEWMDESVNFYIYMLPEYDSLADAMMRHADTDGDAIPIDKLQTFNEMTTSGTRQAADNVEMMTGIPTEAEVTQLSFAPIEDVPRQIGTDTYVGTVVEFTGTPSGYLMVLFDERSAVTVAEAMMPVEMDSDELTEQHEMAIEELGNIMTSGFVDGWANVLQTSVDHTPPRLVHDMGRAIVDPLAAQVGQHQEHAFIIDSKMRTDDIEFEAEIHALPNERELRAALDDLDVERADETDADVEQIFE